MHCADLWLTPRIGNAKAVEERRATNLDPFGELHFYSRRSFVRLRNEANKRLIIPRKEVIQPHLPIRLPCYDLVPLTSFTFGASLLAVRTTTSGATNSGGLTGGVYKAQEQIHRGVADPRLLAIPASCGRIAAHNLN